MAIQINEQKMIDENIFLYEERLNSPLRRFTDKSFVPVRYWHVKANESTVDPGFGDISELLGDNSPTRYQRIDNFPIYGLEALILQLSDTEQGLDSSFESDGLIMAGTITPVQNDFFIINHVKDSFIFRVTGVEYDTVSSSSCYKIQYVLEYIDVEKEEQLDKQTVSDFTCVLENIGTEERCIVEKSEEEKISKINEMYSEIAENYITFYYNERYNCLLGDFGNGMKLFDPFMIEFINEHRLFAKKNQIDNLIMTEQFEDNRRKIKYQKTIYSFFETLNMKKLSTFGYTVFSGKINHQTAFYRWLDDSVLILDIPKNIEECKEYEIIPKEFAESIRLNGPTESIYANLLQRFARKEEITIDDINLDLGEELLNLDDDNLEVFFFTPIILYIIKTVVNKQLRTKFED